MRHHQSPLLPVSLTYPKGKEVNKSQTQAQTPQQRRANERYAKQEATKRGRPETVIKAKPKQKSPVPIVSVVILAFVLCGGFLFEVLRLVPELWSAIASWITKWTS
ncbi:hypothetical protein AJ79_00164 [Helicocarpus griseus UAMH5409]|uniref:Stress-associated endoplasmic reticulum protein n=1 Tax=Helicocarpus griseus UAMH5409 TaxID=1447875 RepID=A0A2B7YCG1_9EURO|nr:hypothetical protein AJ79_00164 [Helicocarpus griseus UAMH5409]